MENVLYTDIELVVHKLIGEKFTLDNGQSFEPVESVILLPGQSIPTAQLASYQRNVKIPGVKICTQEEANTLALRYAPSEELHVDDEETPGEEETLTVD